MSATEEPASTSPAIEQAGKKSELRSLKVRIKEVREIVKILSDKRKDLEARETALAAELGLALKPRKGPKAG